MLSAAGSNDTSREQKGASLIITLVAATFFMENLDGTIIATALPQMAHSFGVHPADMSLGITVYLLTLAVFIPISGWAADRFGLRTVFGSAIAVFTAASVLCATTTTLPAFAAARVLQGIGGAMMVPVGRLAVLRATKKDDLMRAIAIITWPGLVAPVIGPPLGGFITTYSSWRWIFYLNVPLGIVGLLLTLRYIDNVREDTQRRFDLPGFALCGIACTTLLYAMELVGRTDADWPMIGALVAVGAVASVASYWHLRRAAQPVVDLSALKVKTFAVAMGGGSLFRIAISAAPFLLPLMFQVGFGMNAFESGLLTLAVFAGNLSMKLITTQVMRRFGFRPVLIVNGVLAALSLAAMSLLTPSTPKFAIAVVLFASGLSRSLQFTALNTLSFADVPKTQMSGASALSSTLFQMTMGVGVAVGAIALRFGEWLHGHDAHSIGPEDFSVAFLIVALVGLLGVANLFGLARDAGALVSEHRKEKA
ncbi:Permease of the major facilitator superfamily [Candidatus Burkholderia verschuerenii]|uniref:Permease of the major facilitator superfamily n=1 Tax=Candidatus Burkholderia verschuerenii TaxID=242163 RepID=A0A0L0MIQ5_9BURK|nr:MFS transporter [Candidatus Burkholderia verschuerenii]KND61879.1 Permease of the major facilitator superfamily [Candidatus Burkholderia verschuerenii]